MQFISWDRDRPGRSGRPTRQRQPDNLFRSPAGQSAPDLATTIWWFFARCTGFRPEAENGERDARAPRIELHRSGLERVLKIDRVRDRERGGADGAAARKACSL
jgi:hypothetical protein